GTDGVQKMSKSYGNYIGINEPPQQIYGKVMSISDELMWRYYELLTDVRTDEIIRMKGWQNPMDAKKRLARGIVHDFHGGYAAKEAEENWSKQFQRSEVPDNLEIVEKSVAKYRTAKEAEAPGTITWRLDKLLLDLGLVSSASEGNRKIKEGAVDSEDAVFINAFRPGTPSMNNELSSFPTELTIRVGRKYAKVRLTL
ncbi:MAG TPA: tyrosine--tRNA ligase, partial [Candidatus Angelobacter sp.]|nr:tyrosine--tRNA ligase [Candidatus Angelobacter sp.]